jgi:hypothetical protein
MNTKAHMFINNLSRIYWQSRYVMMDSTKAPNNAIRLHGHEAQRTISISLVSIPGTI